MHNYPLWLKVIKLYKRPKNRKKKFLDEVTTVLIYSHKGGVGGVSSEIITFCVGLYSVNGRETLFL